MSYSYSPDRPSYDGLNEVRPGPRTEALAPHAGAAAMTGETNTPDPNSGEATLQQIRDLFRSGDVKLYSAPSSPDVVRYHPRNHRQMLHAAALWRSQHQPDNRVADEVVSRLTSAWAKVAVATNNPNFMAYETLLTSTLSTLYSDVLYAVNTLGLRGTVVPNVIFNSREELETAKKHVSESDVMSLADFNDLTAQARTDLLKTVKQTERNIRAVHKALSDGTLPRHKALDHQVIFQMAKRKNLSEKDCLKAIRRYIGSVEDLIEKHNGHRTLTPVRISDTCRSNPNDPEKALGDKFKTARALTTKFSGQGGLTWRDIEEVVFTHQNPERVIRNIIRSSEAISLTLGGRLPPTITRKLMVKYGSVADGIIVGRQILGQAERLKGQLAGNAEVPQAFTDADFIDFAMRRVTAQGVATLARRIVIAREHFKPSSGVPESIIRKASLTPGDVIENTQALIAEIRNLSLMFHKHDIPASVIEDAVTQDGSAKKHIQDFMRIRNSAMRQFAGHLPQQTINETCANHDDPLDRLGRMVSVQDKRRQSATYGAGEHNTSGQPNRPYNASNVLADMQRLSREHRRGGSSAHLSKSLQPHIEEVRAKLEDWAASLMADQTKVAPKDVVDRFARMYYNYVRYGEDRNLTDDPQMLQEVFSNYCKYVLELSAAGFNYSSALAQFNSRSVLLGGDPEDTTAKRRASNWGGTLNFPQKHPDLAEQLSALYPERIDSEFEDRLAHLSDDERELIRYILGPEASYQKTKELCERLGAKDLEAYYNGLLRYLGLRDEEPVSDSPDYPAASGLASTSQQHREAGPTPGNDNQGSILQKILTEIGNLIEVLEKYFVEEGAMSIGAAKFAEATSSFRAAMKAADDATRDIDKELASLSADIASEENPRTRGQPANQTLLEQLYAQKEALDAERQQIGMMKTAALDALITAGRAQEKAVYIRGIADAIIRNLTDYKTSL